MTPDYNAITLLGSILLFYALVGRELENWGVSGPILLVATGIGLGPWGLSLISPTTDAVNLRIIAELALAILLCVESAKSNIRDIARSIQIAWRLIVIALPLTILLGTGLVLLGYPNIGWVSALIIGAILAPTDMALAKPVVKARCVALRIRTALKLESSLNDGLVVPILIVAALVHAAPENFVLTHELIWHFVQEILIAVSVGAGGALLVYTVVHLGRLRIERDKVWQPVPVTLLALTCFALAQQLGGSGLIAAFVAGLMLSAFDDKERHPLVHAAEGIGDFLAFLAWIAFGVLMPMFFTEGIDMPFVIVYALLSLTVIRILPTLLALTGSNLTFQQMMLVGWFGPRGLASLAFALALIPHDLVARTMALQLIGVTVLLSLFLHGVSARLLR
ncbi:MAG: cation:proton antiporter [Deinococcota bacterium]